jgi:hypothetical protein
MAPTIFSLEEWSCKADESLPSYVMETIFCLFSSGGRALWPTNTSLGLISL